MSVHGLAVFAATLACAVGVAAQEERYTVWSSVVFARGGERTPETLGEGSLPTVLTSLGADQMYSVGTDLRARYMGFANASMGGGPIQDLSRGTIDYEQIYIAAMDAQHTIASAQAFMQGLYPPYAMSKSTALAEDPSSILANGSFLAGPLQGYQYPVINTIDPLHPEWPLLAGQGNCPAFAALTQEYENSASTQAIAAITEPIYALVGPPLLEEVLPSKYWSYINAYMIFDYLNYENVHNTTKNALLATPAAIDPSAHTNFLSQMRWLADEQLWALNGNLTATNGYTRSSSNPWKDGNVMGSISTIGGNYLAGKMLSQLQSAVATNATAYKLSVLFGDFRSMISLFALLGLTDMNNNFYGQPDFGSIATFELFSMTDANDDAPAFPAEEDLWVRFYFRNGTDMSTTDDANAQYLSYSLFGNGPSLTDIPWNQFADAINTVAMTDVGDWCTQCGATTIFCAAYNASDALLPKQTDPSSIGASSGPISPAVAGVLGMASTLLVLSLAIFAAMLFGGVRFCRVPTSKSDLAGFKGDRKHASDLDLVIPKNQGIVTVTNAAAHTLPPGVHVRQGSWELCSHLTPMVQTDSIRGAGSARPSMEIADADAIDFRRPVQPRESF